MNFLLNANSVSEQIVGEFGWAALYAVVGFIIVIAALIVLIILLTLLTKILNVKLPKKEKSITGDTATTDYLSTSQNNDGEIVAAITAAISAVYASESGSILLKAGEFDDTPPPPFVIKSIKKI